MSDISPAAYSNPNLSGSRLYERCKEELGFQQDTPYSQLDAETFAFWLCSRVPHKSRQDWIDTAQCLLDFAEEHNLEHLDEARELLLPHELVYDNHLLCHELENDPVFASEWPGLDDGSEGESIDNGDDDDENRAEPNEKSLDRTRDHAKEIQDE